MERAGSILDELCVLDRRHPGTRAQVLARMPATLVRQVTEGTRADWCSIEASAWLCDLTVEILGEPSAHVHWVVGVTEHLERPVLRHFAAGVRSLFRSRPERLVDLVPRAWSLLFRDVCVVRTEHHDDRSATVLFDDVAREVCSRPSFLLNWRARLEGLGELIQPGTQVKWRTQPDARHLEATFLFPATFAAE